MTELRRVDVSSCDLIAPADQAEPQLSWVEIDCIRIDDSYQRQLAASNWKAIRRIAQDFRWSRFAPVLLAPIAGGLYSLLDGQHRVHAAAICGFKTVPAMIALLPREELARAFIEINTAAIRVTPHQVYRAALTAGEPWAIASRDAVQAAGCRLMTRNNVAQKDKKPRDVYCLQTVRRSVDAGRADAVTAALAAMADYDAAGRVPLWSDYVLRPWIEAVVNKPGASPEHLSAALDRRDPFLVI